MKAAVLIQQNRPLNVQCFKRPTPKGYQVLVRIYCSGLCGAQLNEIVGFKGPDKFLPHLMGHEGSGIVEAVGESVSKVAAGDRVVLHWRKGSGGEGPFPSYEAIDGTAVGGGFVTTFADMALIAENRVTRISSDIPFDIACLFGCGIPTGYGIVNKELKLQAGACLAVIGCGGVGLNVINAARVAGASVIVGVDKHAGKKAELARTMGATDYICLQGGGMLEKELKAKTMTGFDAIVDTTGDTELLRQAFRAVSRTGTLMLVGQTRAGEPLVLEPALDLFTGKRLMISEGGGFDPDADMPKLEALYRRDPNAMRRVITNSFRLDDVNEAVAALQTGQCGRILLETIKTV